MRAVNLWAKKLRLTGRLGTENKESGCLTAGFGAGRIITNQRRPAPLPGGERVIRFFSLHLCRHSRYTPRNEKRRIPPEKIPRRRPP